MTGDLDALVEELRALAARLRAGEAEPEEAAELVERCVELAGGVTSELDRQARLLEGADAPGQERLL